jgi:hypothetical protein
MKRNEKCDIVIYPSEEGKHFISSCFGRVQKFCPAKAIVNAPSYILPEFDILKRIT